MAGSHKPGMRREPLHQEQFFLCAQSPVVMDMCPHARHSVRVMQVVQSAVLFWLVSLENRLPSWASAMSQPASIDFHSPRPPRGVSLICWFEVF